MHDSNISARVRGMPLANLDIPDRVVEKVRLILESYGDDNDVCWLWPMSIFKTTGYGQIAWYKGDGRQTGTTAHRVAWITTHGPIPMHMTVDHRCRVRSCVNPAHLRLLSNIENARDNGQGRKTHCPKGHPYDEINTYRDSKGHRYCRKCARDAYQRRTITDKC